LGWSGIEALVVGFSTKGPFTYRSLASKPSQQPRYVLGATPPLPRPDDDDDDHDDPQKQLPRQPDLDLLVPFGARLARIRRGRAGANAPCLSAPTWIQQSYKIKDGVSSDLTQCQLDALLEKGVSSSSPTTTT
jgi:hypothetical protein